MGWYAFGILFAIVVLGLSVLFAGIALAAPLPLALFFWAASVFMAGMSLRVIVDMVQNAKRVKRNTEES